MQRSRNWKGIYHGLPSPDKWAGGEVNRTIVNSLRGFVSQYQKNRAEFTSAITFGYNFHIHSSLGLAPFEQFCLALRCPSLPSTRNREMNSPRHRKTTVPAEAQGSTLSRENETSGVPGALQEELRPDDPGEE
jgi:hypothetical protein